MPESALHSDPAGARTAFVLKELIIVLLICAILSVILIFRVRAARELQRRTLCARNLQAIGTGMFMYADSNHDEWPMAVDSHTPNVGERTITYGPRIIGHNRQAMVNPSELQAGQGDARVSTTRGLWMLLHAAPGIVTQNTFVCPSSPDRPNSDPSPQAFWDFRSYSEVSYGYQVPFGRWGRPSPDRHNLMTLAADKGPYGAAMEAGKSNPGPLPVRSDGGLLVLPLEGLSRWNSPNHGGGGQCMLFADSHANFETRPLSWASGHDNIYTQWSTPEGLTIESRVIGVPPTGNETPMSNTDTLIYP